MIMADVFKFLFLVLGGLVIVISYWLLAESLFTRVVRRARDSYMRRPFRTVLVGAAAGVPISFIGIALLSSGGGLPQAMGFAVMSAVVIAGLLGSAGLALLVGEGLPTERDVREPWRATLRGGAVLSIACLMPFAGWFFVVPVALASGVGALILAAMPVRSRGPRAEVVDGVQA